MPLVETLLLVGITGAGLVLTVYSLVVSRADELLSVRVADWKQSKMTLEEQMNKLKGESNSEQFTRIRHQLDKVESMSAMPNYLGGLVLAFGGYSLLSILALILLSGGGTIFGFEIVNINLLLLISFVSTAALAFSGLYGIGDVNKYLNMKYKKMKEAG
jgi:hypothetical protein